MHPEYTGVQPEMSALSTAEKHQKMRDREMEKFVKEYGKGLIDKGSSQVISPGSTPEKMVEIQRNTIAELFKFSSHAYSILNEFTTRVVQLEDGVQPETSTLSTSEKNQKMREKFVEDHDEGRIDENGKARPDKYTR
ncbi:hypothetical protein B5807_02311 [Epicoccum nigrum]|uniref:Uncharacterized protein n=1 Tax=Epicoccum nigrum TaxID=105696 RepID=A0A1Y2M9W2_EPING|nr:hypothetical protein B5807_02311 [Epicoccum nigrum]